MPFRRLLLCVLCWSILQVGSTRAASSDAEYLHTWNSLITTLMIRDGFHPPLASRTYAYPNVAAYEALVHGSPQYTSLAGRLNGLDSLPQPDTSLQYDWTVAAVTAFARVAQQLVYREEECIRQLAKDQETLGARVQNEQVMQRSINYGETLAKAILRWAAADKYTRTKALPRYIFSNEDGHWKPTPTDFRSALEPHWNTLRPFALTNADQFPCPGPVPYNPDTTSAYYKHAIAVYNAVQNLTDEQRTFVLFWDDNPDQVFVDGHFGTPRRHRTPTAHWIGITQTIARMQQLPAMETAEVYSLVSVALADAFISCWNEKYKHDFIRPITYINAHVDPTWLPPLVTPPFPEYTSGHSAISASAATVLSHLFGDNFAFTDSTGVYFGFPPRSFSSFHEAAYEAGISRFYGGIHYMFSINDANEEGRKIGAWVLSTARTKKEH